MTSEDSPALDAADAGPIPTLSAEEARVLGCLIEKEMTTPEYYPLTLKALMAACNQKSNRHPVTEFDSATVSSAVEDLRYHHFALSVHESGARGPKTRHTLEKVFPYLSKRHFALLGVLLLRGQQTLGELRQRTERMFAFSDLESTQAALEELANYDSQALVREIPAGGGRRVVTFVQLLTGDDPSHAELPATASAAPAASSSTVDSPTWRENMEDEIESLRAELDELKAELARLRNDLGENG